MESPAIVGPGRNGKVAHLPAQCAVGMSLKNSRGANVLELREMLAGSTGLEPAASGVTGRRSNQLNYDPKLNFERQSAKSKLIQLLLTCALRTSRLLPW